MTSAYEIAAGDLSWVFGQRSQATGSFPWSANTALWSANTAGAGNSWAAGKSVLELIALAVGFPLTSDQRSERASAAERAADQAEEPLVYSIDWKDIRSSLDGDGQAFARLVSRYQDQIAAQMWRLSRQQSDCEQLVQDVFVEAYVSLKKYQGRAPFLHWLRKIATRVGYRYWKQQAKQRQRSSVPLQDWHRTSDAAPREQTAEEAATLVHSVLGQLPPRDRLVLTLMYLEGCSIAEAAELSGWSQTMVKVQAHRARKKLKKLLDEANP